MKKIAILLLVAASMAQGAPLKEDLAPREAKVRFLAVGKPSMLKIHGTAEDDRPLRGSVSVENGKLSADATLALDSLDTGISLRNRHMKEKYLHTGKYPEARLKIRDLALPPSYGAEGKAEEVAFTGELTLHGNTRPVKGTLSVRPDADRLLSLQFRLSIDEFGIETPEFMGIKVTDEVNVEVDVASR